MFTVATPAIIPALVNSVISVGSSAPSGLVLRSYQPYPGRSPKSFANPERLVESARSADAAMKSGRPYSWRAIALTHELHAPKAVRLACLSPALRYIAAG